MEVATYPGRVQDFKIATCELCGGQYQLDQYDRPPTGNVKGLESNLLKRCPYSGVHPPDEPRT